MSWHWAFDHQNASPQAHHWDFYTDDGRQRGIWITHYLKPIKTEHGERQFCLVPGELSGRVWLEATNLEEAKTEALVRLVTSKLEG